MHIQGYPAKDKSHKNPVRRFLRGIFVRFIMAFSRFRGKVCYKTHIE
jgi:hypothetical protein